MDWETGVWEMRQKQKIAMREVEASRLARLARAAQAEGREPAGHLPAQLAPWIGWVRHLHLPAALHRGAGWLPGAADGIGGTQAGDGSAAPCM